MAEILMRVQNVETFLEGTLPKSVREEIQEVLSYTVPNYKYTKLYKQQEQQARLGILKGDKWDGTVSTARPHRKGNCVLKLPSGLFSYVKEILDRNKITYETRDERPALIKDKTYGLSGLVLRDYQREPVDTFLKRGRGILKASTGCHSKGQKILMFDGSIKNVEDIDVGDVLMGPESRPKTVLSLCRGKGQMYEVIPVKGGSFIVNDDHILTLKRTGQRKYSASSKTRQYQRRKNDNNETIDIRLGDWLQWSAHRKHLYKLVRVQVDFPNISNLDISPYLLGLLLADGHLSSGHVGLTNYAFKSNSKDTQNTVLEAVKKLGLYKTNSGSKFVPQEYKTASRQDRLQLLAGYLDGDGSLHCNFYDAVSKSLRLAADLAFIARSVGLASYIKPCEKTCTKNGTTGEYYRFCISGNTDMIPCKLSRKQADPRSQKKDVLKTGFRTKKLGTDNYYGFTLDGDGRYLLDDFTVTHNSGKTEMVIAMTVEAGAYPAIFYVNSCDLLEQAYDRFRKYVTYNGEPAEIGRIGSGHCDIKPITIATVQSCERALTGKHTKNTEDDYHPDDKTKLDKAQKEAVCSLISEAQFTYCDEVHHVSAKTFQTILNASFRSKLRVGGSASPWRDDGLDILIEACFGRYLCDINASFLINEGYLVKPYITFNHFNQVLGPEADWRAHYNVYVAQNDDRNLWIANRTKYHIERDRPTIVLVKWTSHAEILQEMMGDLGIEVPILTSSGKKKKLPKKRKEILDKFRNREIMGVIGTSLLDEGVDVPSAGAGIFAGGGKSSTRELQRVGRLIRTDPNDPNKRAAFIEEFFDHTRWLSYHAKQRRKILQLEREFEIGDRRII